MGGERYGNRFLIVRGIKTLLSSSDTLVIRVAFTIVAFCFQIYIFVFQFIGAVIMAINSRRSEFLADGFAYRTGFGANLINALYLLQQIDMGGKIPLKDKILSSHPYLPARIARLEKAEQDAVVTAES